MKIILSPTKKMKYNHDDFGPLTTPKYLDKAKKLYEYMQGLSVEELQEQLKCNASIAEKTYQMYRKDFHHQVSMALTSFDGLVFQYMKPDVFDEQEMAYIRKHLLILSGMYGYVRPSDGIGFYRLDLENCIEYPLYEYWKDLALDFKDEVIINLASKEYSLLFEGCRMIHIHFVSEVNGNYITKATLAKMARGSMVRYMAKHQITNVEELKKFQDLQYQYSEALSDDNNYYFIRKAQ